MHGLLYNRAPVDIRSTGAGIKCLYSTSEGIEINHIATDDGIVIRQYYLKFKGF